MSLSIEQYQTIADESTKDQVLESFPAPRRNTRQCLPNDSRHTDAQSIRRKFGFSAFDPSDFTYSVIPDCLVRSWDPPSGHVAGGTDLIARGKPGSGKSTLMKILVGALQADAGHVTRQGTVGWCPQKTLLYDRLTVAETFDLFGEAYELPHDRVIERRDDLAERLDFQQFLDYRVDHLSGGNRQKVNLAIALLHDPDLLCLDEPYTGFDWETYLAFWDLTDALVEDGTTIAVISHLISERERFDRILELEEGTLTEQSSPPQQARSSAHDRQARSTDEEEAVTQEG